MKKITFSFLFSLFFLTAIAQQFEFKQSNGTPITNGSVLSYGTVGSYLNFRVTNTGSIPLDIRIKCTNLTNTNGTQFELCYGGSCFDSVFLNGVFPDYENPLAPGQSNPAQGDHFVNFNTGSGAVLDYTFSVYAIGFESNAISFTYRYDPQLNLNSLNDLANLGITTQNTIVTNNLSFNSDKAGKIVVFNLNGQQITEFPFEEGSHKIELNQLRTGIYIAQFSTYEGRTSQIKFLKN